MLKGRLEDDRMLTGRGRYVSDWNLPGQAYGAFPALRSRARRDRLDRSQEKPLAIPALSRFSRARRSVDLKSLPAALPAKGRGGSGAHQSREGRRWRKGRVRFAGDAVALIVAESALAAQDAAELIAIEYRDLPAVVERRGSARRGRAAGARRGAGQHRARFRVGRRGRRRAQAFESAARVVKIDGATSRAWSATRWSRAPASPRSCPTNTISTRCTQGVAIMRNQLSAVLGVPPEKIRVDRRGSRRRLRRALQPLSRNTARCCSRRRRSAGR